MLGYQASFRLVAAAGMLSASSHVANAGEWRISNQTKEAARAELARFPAGEWQICNQTNQDLIVAIGFSGTSPSLNVVAPTETRGWWRINACGGCATVLQARDATDFTEVYLRAETTHGGQFIGGPWNSNTRFCTRPQPFTIRAFGHHWPACDLKPFKPEHIDLNKHFTTNITGGPPCPGRL
jgi:uncharacterized membrane protein